MTLHSGTTSKTERLLYSLPALKLKVAQDEEDLGTVLSLRRRNPDVVRPSTGGYRQYDPDEREERYIEQRKESMERTKGRYSG